MKAILNVLIGWSQGSAERNERDAAKWRAREARFRAAYEHRWPNPWRRA